MAIKLLVPRMGSYASCCMLTGLYTLYIQRCAGLCNWLNCSQLLRAASLKEGACRKLSVCLQRQRKQQQRQRHMEANIEPELMERLMMLPLDERIRETDAPERFQLTSEADLRDTFSDEQLQDAAR